MTLSHTDLDAAEKAFLQRDWTKAAALYDRALSSAFPPEAWMAYARSLQSLDRLEDAFHAAERALAFSPKELVPWLLCGDLARELAELELTEAEAEDNTQAWQRRAEKLYTAALQIAESYNQDQRQDVLFWETHGYLLERLGRSVEGLQSYKQALVIEPHRVTSWVGCGRILRQLGRLDEALASYDSAVKIDPGKACCWTARARILDKVGKLDEAAHSYEKALELRPEQAFYWARHGKLLDELGRFEEALQSYNRALQLKPERTHYWKRKARILQKLGRLEEAQTNAEQAARLLSH